MAGGINVGEAFVKIRPDTEGFTEETSSGITGSMNGIVSAIGAYAIGTKVKQFLGDAFEAASENVKVGAQTEAVIKSTGQAAGVTAEQVGKLAESLSRKVGQDDEMIQRGQNMLLTFTNIKNAAGEGNDIFNQATKASLNLATAMGTDMASSALQVGKALNDPIQGVAALRRVGVQLSDAQEKQVKDFMAVNDVASAQKIILDELNKEFGGSAAAQATAADKMKVAYDNLKEEIGMALLPVIKKLSDVLLPLFKYLQEHRGVLLGIAAVIGGALAAAFIAWAVAAAQAAAATLAATWPVVAIGAAVAALVIGILWLWNNWEKVWTWIKEHKALAAVIAILSPFLAIIVGITLAVRYVYDHWSTIWPKIQEITKAVVDFLEPVIERLKSSLNTIGDVIVWVANAYMDYSKWVINAVIDIYNFVAPIVAKIVDVIGKIAGVIWDVAKAYWDVQVEIVKAVTAVVDFILGVPERLYNAGKAMAEAIGNGFKSAWNAIADFINDAIPDKISIPLAPDIDLPDNPIPKFHLGGIVPGLPGQESLAVLQAGERVIPAGQNGPAGGGLIVQGDLVIGDRSVLGDLDYWARTRMAGV